MSWCSNKIVHLLFDVFQIKLNNAANIFLDMDLPEWIRNVQMIPGFCSIKT